jgi:hypothetical protein
MTQTEHTFIAGIIIFILYQIVFHTYLKHRPASKKSMQELSDIFDEYFK